MIRNLVFDFGGVLLDWNPHYVYDDYFGSREQADWFLANVTTMAWNGLMDLGRTFSECVAELQAQWPEWAEAIAVYQSRWFEMIGGEVEGMPQLLADLDRLGVPLYGLTNWSMETFPRVRAGHSLFRHFRGIVVSAEEGVAKPDPRLYRILLDRYGLQAGETLFIDDNRDNVEGARRVGMEGWQFTGAADLRAVLRQRMGLQL